MDNFNIKRFAHTFRWYFCENRSRLLAWSAGLALGIFVAQSFFLWIAVGQIKGLQLTPEITSSVCGPITGICVLLTLWYVFSQIFSTLKTKQKRIAYLTLPATNLERYLAAFLMTAVVWLIFILLAVALGDTLRMVFFGLLGKGWVSGVVAYLSRGCNQLTGWAAFMDNALDLSTWFWVLSFYILSGTLLSKREFLLGSLAQIVIIVAYIWVFYKFNFQYSMLMNIDEATGVTHVNLLMYVVVLGLLALSILNIWGSYQLFKRFQIITSKWFNV